MTEEQRIKCHTIIHTAAAGAGAGNLVPIPGTGLAADTIAITAMTMSLSAVLGLNITNEVAKGIGIMALKEVIMRQPVKCFVKECVKIIPFFGQAFSGAVSAGIIEVAGWQLCKNIRNVQLSSLKHHHYAYQSFSKRGRVEQCVKA